MALHNFIRLEAIIMGKLDGKVAVIAGASSGLGYAEAETFAREGAKVVIFARGEDKLMEKKAELEGKGYEVLALVADAGKQEDWNRVVSEAVARFGRIDILMNNAGIMSSEYAAEEQTFGENFKPEAFMAGVNQCFTSQLMGIFACWPELKKTHGCVVNTASEHALNTMVPLSHYGVSKAAVRFMTRSLASQLAEDGIRVNDVVPGFILTGLIPWAADTELPATKAILEHTKIKRIGEPQDIANAALYLASEDAKYVTGAEIVVDGGYQL